jgi:hypothetical protein
MVKIMQPFSQVRSQPQLKNSELDAMAETPFQVRVSRRSNQTATKKKCSPCCASNNCYPCYNPVSLLYEAYPTILYPYYTTAASHNSI